MGEERTKEVTALLRSWRAGDGRALDRLVPLVYDELRALARRVMSGERRDHTLQPTVLVHEAYRRLVTADVPWEDRAHFFNVAARTMRRVLVEHARARAAAKRGAAARRRTLDETLASVDTDPEGMLALDIALERLAELDDRKCRAIELHYFGGLTYDELARSLEISRATVHREMRLARAWLARELGGGATHG